MHGHNWTVIAVSRSGGEFLSFGSIALCRAYQFVAPSGAPLTSPCPPRRPVVAPGMEDDSYTRPDTRLLGAYWLDLSRLPRDHCVCREVGRPRPRPASRSSGVHTAVALL